MELKGVGTSNLSQEATQTTANDAMGRDDFLLLLTTQITNQNPLEQQEGAEFVAQLAQFSTLELITELKESFDDVASTQAALLAGQVLTLVGHTGVFPGSFADLPAEGAVNLSYEVPPEADVRQLRLEILGPAGEILATVAGDPQAGFHSVPFSGFDADGARLPPGRYTFQVVATDGRGERVAVESFATGKLDGVTYENGLPQLTSGQERIDPKDITRILN